MSLSLGIATYFIIWWIVLFAVLPFGVRTQGEDGKVVPGTPASAPARLRLARVFATTTIVAAVVFLLVRWLYVSPAARTAVNRLVGFELLPQ